MWVVGINRPYYPSVKFYENQNEADKEYLELLKENYNNGEYEVIVFKAKVEYSCNIKTEY